jgi:hypothetical protein
MLPWYFWWPFQGLYWLSATVSVVLILGPWLNRARFMSIVPAVLLANAVLAGPWILHRRYVLAWAGAVLAAAVFLAAERFDGSYAWYRIGIAYGAEHYQDMTKGMCHNLAAILQTRYRWQLQTPADLSWLGLADPVPLQSVLRYAWLGLLIACGAGLAVQDAQRNRGFLVAVVAPWLLFFAILPQMHERYLVYAAAISAAGIGVSLGFALLHVLISALALSQMAHTMLRPGFGEQWLYAIARIHPDAGWIILLVTAIYVFHAMAPQRRSLPLTR